MILVPERGGTRLEVRITDDLPAGWNRLILRHSLDGLARSRLRRFAETLGEPGVTITRVGRPSS